MRKLIGQVVSDKMKKTVVVAVTLMREHSKYHKTYSVVRRFKAHDEKSEYKTGDTVVIGETKPLSREKRWKVVEKVKGNPTSPKQVEVGIRQEKPEETQEVTQS